MNLNILKNVKFDKIANTAKVVGHHLREVRPEIMLGVGAVSVLAGTVLACVKTNSASPVIHHIKTSHEELEFVRKNAQADEKPTVNEYVHVYVRGGVELVKIYALPVGLWVGGMACIFGSHGEMRTRNAKLLANSVALKKFFDEYRQLVRNEIGEEKERDLYFGAEDQEIEIEETDPATGEKTVKKTRGKVLRQQPGSMYARNFTPRTSDEFDIRRYADDFLDARIKKLNSRLRLEPFITLNDVYDELGMKPGEGRCVEGMTVGWVWHPKIDRGDREIRIERLEGWEETYDSITGRTKLVPCLRLDFNCYPLEGLI